MDKTKLGCWSHLPKLTLIITLGLATTLTSQKASAVDVNTDPVGFVTISTLASNSVPNAFPFETHWTLANVFGLSNSAGLLGGTASTADSIQIWTSNQPQGYTAVYYFKTSGLGGTGWRSTANTSVNCSNDVLYIEQGLTIVRKGAT